MNLQFGPTIPPEVDRSLLLEINGERFRMLLTMMAPAVVMGSVFAIVAAAFFHHRTGQAAIGLWLALKLGFGFVRLAHRQWHLRQQARFDHRPWQLQNMVLLAIDGLIWGAAGWLAAQTDDATALMVAVSLAGVAAMGAVTLQSSCTLVAAYCLPMVLPVALLLLARQTPFGLYGGLSLITFSLCLMAVCWLAQQRIFEMLVLRFTNAQLAKEREAALQLAHQQNVEKSQFVATMSHELRTPLHGILGLTRMLRDANMAPSDLGRLALVERSGEHLLTVINNILDYSRIEAGHLSVESQTFDLCALMDDVASLTAVNAQAKGLSLTLDCQLPPACQVKGDPARLRQILLNLVGNAVKFTQQGGVKIQVLRKPSRSSQDGAMVFRVQDSGVGIAPADLAQIFAPFKQAESTSPQHFDGTGLGLTISRAMARAMQGDITCTSTLGKGSIFELQLPLPVAIPAPHAPLASPLAAPRPHDDTQEAAALLLQGHVLLAEDNEVNAMVVEALLKRLGLTVDLCADGNEVIQRVCQGRARPDLILMDCLMPQLDGFETTRLLRTDEQTRGLPRLPVIALTASALSEDSARCRAAGMDDYLSKPFKEDQLHQILLKYLAQARQPEYLGHLTPAVA